MRKTVALFVILGSCDTTLPTGKATPITFFTAKLSDSRFHVADHFMASMEMQISGEPFAQLIGRDLAGYDRFPAKEVKYKTDVYADPATGLSTVDPMGYSLGVESYEYSKQPMNNISFEAGAGLSVEYGPVTNPTGLTGDAAFANLRDRLQHLADASGVSGPVACPPGDSDGGIPDMAGCTPVPTNFVVSPAPSDNLLNPYGWPGFWPQFAEFRSFDPSIHPQPGMSRGCTLTGGYAASVAGAQPVGDYECGYNELNLPKRETQVEKVLEPAALGFAAWKQGLWVINYWGSLHDTAGNPISQVAPADLAQVGQPGNTVVGQYPDSSDSTGMAMIDGVPGTYFGDVSLEGWQGLNMLEEMHNKAALLLGQISTADGTKLDGFASTKAALAYDYQTPLRWWPSAIAVTETGTDPPAAGAGWRDFPKPDTFTIQTASSDLRGLLALAGGFSELFALTDFGNPDVGGLVSSLASFDGDPFPADNQKPDGEDTPHDRALAVIKVALINLDRLHFDATNNVFVDQSTVSATASGATVSRGKTVSSTTAAYTIVALRTALRSISSSLQLYSNDTPDTLGGATALDGTSMAGSTTALPDRIVQLIRAEADFIMSKLTDAKGRVANSYDLGAQKVDGAATTIDSEASAIRGLLDAYLATSDTKYEQAAELIYGDLDRSFWMNDVRVFRSSSDESDTLTYTPVRFGTVQGALRQYWKLVGNAPGNERLSAEILERIQRMNKLIANGWDDANGDNVVQYPDECTGAGLQMAERALTGELSNPDDDGERDKDCVQEIAAAGLPSALAAQVVFTRR